MEPKTLPPGERVIIRYTLSQSAKVHIDLVDEEGFAVRRLDIGEQSAGRQEISWNGRLESDVLAQRGVYRYVIHATNAAGVEAIFDPSAETGGEELQAREFTYDQQHGALRWIMPRAGYARLRLGIEGFPHVRTILDWEPLEGGQHAVKWDGLDESGLLRIGDHPQRDIRLTTFALPDNTIIVQGDRASKTGAAGPASPLYPPLTKSESAYYHARHPRDRCHEVAFRVDFPESVGRSPEGYPIVSGRVPVRVTIDPRDADELVNRRFEVAIFEALTILFEVEEGSNPFTFMWDTASLPAGPNVLVINVLSYDDHFGVQSVPVVVEPGGAAS